MAGFLGARGLGAAAVLLAGLTALPAMAEDVPLPRPNPHRALVTGSVRDPIPAAALRARAQAPAPQQAQAAPNPISNPFAALLGKPGSTQALNPQQRAIIDRVNNYLTSVQTLTGKFVQIGPDGGRTTGIFNILKPGRVRFEYDSPSPIELGRSYSKRTRPGLRMLNTPVVRPPSGPICTNLPLSACTEVR